MGTQLPQLPPLFQNPYGPAGTVPDPRHLIHYATDGVQPPSQIYLDNNDKFRIEIESFDQNFTVEFTYRLLKPNGEIVLGQERFSFVSGNPLFQTFVISTSAEGFLLSATLHSFLGGTFGQRGITHGRVWLIRGTGAANPQYTQVLMQGGVDSLGDLTWPGGLNEPMASGQGAIRNITGTTPAAGADISESIISASRWRLMTMSASLTTSATVATRSVQFVIDDSANIYYAVEAASGQAASLTQRYTFAPAGGRFDKVAGTFQVLPIPMAFLMTSGVPTFHRFRTLTLNIQAGDQWTAPQYVLENWFD